MPEVAHTLTAQTPRVGVLLWTQLTVQAEHCFKGTGGKAMQLPGTANSSSMHEKDKNSAFQIKLHWLGFFSSFFKSRMFYRATDQMQIAHVQLPRHPANQGLEINICKKRQS